MSNLSPTQEYDRIDFEVSGPPWEFIDWLRAHADDRVTEIRQLVDEPEIPNDIAESCISWTTDDGEDHTNTVVEFMDEYVNEA